MHDMKAGPIAGILGVFTLIGVTIALLRPGTLPLPQQVDVFLGSANEESPRDRHQDVAKRIDDVQTLINASEFAKLPSEKQKAMRAHLEELAQFQEYVAQLDKITDPRAARTEEQLRAIKTSLQQLKVPIPYQVEWSQTEAGERHRHWLKDVDAIDQTVGELEKGYQKLCDEAVLLLNDSEGGNLPRRARKILDESKKLPTLEEDGPRPIPGSEHVSYATVFGFARVEFVYDKWKKHRVVLAKLEALGKP